MRITLAGKVNIALKYILPYGFHREYAVNIRPEEFKVGMIVCAQATPTVLTTTKGGSKLILKLRSLLLVNDEDYTVILSSSLNRIVN